jgi:hypothetical protein
MSVIQPHDVWAIVTTNSPECFITKLQANQNAVLLLFRRSDITDRSGYLIEELCMHRETFITYLLYDDPHPHAVTCWCRSYPDNLSDVPGLWHYPLRISLPNLIILDLTLNDALYWLLPILNTLTASSPLRRIHLRFCDDFRDLPFSFPFSEVDCRLSHLPNVKVLISWATKKSEPFVKYFRRKLPHLTLECRLRVLYSEGRAASLFY